MPARLVYAPKAYVMTKNSIGEVLNVTDYVTAGSCQRLINQASTAHVTLRNPQRRFTRTTEPSFHPMDAITIYLERLKGYPVQVFTGYLDDTPYFQMYPGTITLQATCTIKRLMYTYFDPSLPYVNAFLNKFGWLNYQDGTIRQTAAATDTKKASAGADLTDGSIGKILYAVLRDIGEWDDTNIWIENLPNGLTTRIAALMHKISADTQESATEFINFMSEVVGTSSQGSGGGVAGGGSNSTTPSGSGSAPGTPGGGYSPTSWASALMATLGAPASQANINSIVAWENTEGGHWHNSASYNPLNTTLSYAGSSVMGGGSSAGVQAYTSWKNGLQATVNTLNNGNYGDIVAALKAGKGLHGFFQGLLTWSGNGYSSI